MEGPATLIGFLGLELDTEAMEIRLPQGLTMCLPILHHGTTITFPFIVPTGHAASHSHPRELAGPAHRVQAGLDITTLDAAVEYYFRNSLAASTQKSYNSAETLPKLLCKQGYGSHSSIRASTLSICCMSCHRKDIS